MYSREDTIRSQIMGKTKIEWCDYTFNPWIGCAKIAPGCKNCYAEALNKRMGWTEWGKGHYLTSDTNWKKVEQWNTKAFKEDKRYWVFCASLADVFEEGIPDEWRYDLWDMIRNNRNLDWLLLTKRPFNIAKMLPDDFLEDPWDWVWLGTSISSGEEMFQVKQLIDIPAAHRFISAEPLLGKINLFQVGIEKINWIIVGGESGASARPMNPIWALDIALQATKLKIPFFMKQMGSHYMRTTKAIKGTATKGNDFDDLPGYLRIRQFPHVEPNID